jgi:predicted HD phosphohydrolase
MTGPNLGARTIVPFIADIFERRGAESYLGEAVTMSEHMLQSAVLAERAGADENLIDYIDRGIDNLHDEAGARVLAGFFPPLVIACVRLHVAAKRYLCATDPGYFDKLSPASVATLKLQGGPMSPGEIAEFRRDPYYREAVKVRQWDEGGKVPGMKTPPFGYYALLLQRVVDRHMSGAGVRVAE